MSQRIRMQLTIGVGAALLVFGLACLNYTKAEGREHHQEVAARYGLPGPSKAIQYGGLTAIVGGAGAIGYGIGRWRGAAT